MRNFSAFLPFMQHDNFISEQ